MKPKTCVWLKRQIDEWVTDCNNTFQFSENKNPETEGFNYCLFCGRRLKTNDEIKSENIMLHEELENLRQYVDKLAAGLPCLPKDVEVLRDANTKLAQENAELKERLRNRLVVF
jgi:hypothetical protein